MALADDAGRIDVALPGPQGRARSGRRAARAGPARRGRWGRRPRECRPGPGGWRRGPCGSAARRAWQRRRPPGAASRPRSAIRLKMIEDGQAVGRDAAVVAGRDARSPHRAPGRPFRSIVTSERCSRAAVSWATAPFSLPGTRQRDRLGLNDHQRAGGGSGGREQAANRTPARSPPATPRREAIVYPSFGERRLRPLTGFAPPDRMRGLWSSRPPLYCARRRRAKSSTRGPVCWINTYQSK